MVLSSKPFFLSKLVKNHNSATHLFNNSYFSETQEQNIEQSSGQTAEAENGRFPS